MLTKEVTRKAVPSGRAGGVAAPGTEAGPDTARLIARRRALPSGRAVAGGLLVALAALGAYLAATRDGGGPSTRYVVAREAVVPGQQLSAVDVELVAIDLPPAQARVALRDLAAVEAAVALGPIAGGGIVTQADLAPAEQAGAYRELALSLPRARALDGALVVGDRVDVVATADGTSAAVVQHALVLAVGGDGGGALGGGDVVVTLALEDPDAALRTAHAGAAAEVTLLRSTRATAPLPATTQLGAGR